MSEMHDHPEISTTFPFLQGGGACGALLRQMDWSNHPLGRPDEWPESLKVAVSIILGSQQPMFATWAPDHCMLYNDAYAVICGQRHPKAMGMPHKEVWFDIWDFVAPLEQKVLDGESIHMDHVEFVIDRHGYREEAHFSFSYSPLRDTSGIVRGLFCACVETTAQVLLQRDLDRERSMLAQIFENMPSFIAKVREPSHMFEMANPAYLRLVGRKDIVGKTVLEALPEIASQGYVEMLDTVYQTGEPLHLESATVALQRSPDSPTEERLVDFTFQPIRNRDEVINGVLIQGIDVTDRNTALRALQVSEQFLRSVLSASPDCIKVLDLDGRLQFMNERGRDVLELPPEFLTKGCQWPDLWGNLDKSEVLNALERARRGQATEFRAYADTQSGSQRYWDVRVSPMTGVDGQPERILAVSRDISQLKRAEEEREHLADELQHRLNNVFAMVQSVISQTLRHATSVQSARDILSGRVRALAHAQDILTGSMAGDMSLEEVIEAALLPHRGVDGKFDISGPPAIINGHQGLGLSLALHELATNATKYGALSVETGVVIIRWAVQTDGTFTFKWQERDGPVVVAPERSGFGSVLIKNIVATYFSGSAKLLFSPGGVEFELTGMIAQPDLKPASDPC